MRHEHWPWNRAKTPAQLWRGRCRICTGRVWLTNRTRLPNGRLAHRSCYPWKKAP